jgi:hypothetical protein
MFCQMDATIHPEYQTKGYAHTSIETFEFHVHVTAAAVVADARRRATVGRRHREAGVFACQPLAWIVGGRGRGRGSSERSMAQ